MQYKTHLTTSLAVALPIMAATDTLTLGSAIALGLGSVFPDIDEPYSWIGCRTRGISDLINKMFGHRGLTHSLVGIVLIFLTMVLMVGLAHFKAVLGLYFILGYALHLIGDSFSKSGVKWFLPLSDQSFQSGMGLIYYRTGSIIEKLIFFGSILILSMEIRAFDLGISSLVGTNFTKTLSGFTEQIRGMIGF